MSKKCGAWLGALAGAMSLTSSARADEINPAGQALTPTAPPGARFESLNPNLKENASYLAGQASNLALSPDGKTLLILTSGFNRMFGADGKIVPSQSSEWVFVFDVRGAAPVQRQAIAIANTFVGLAWSPAGDRFFVSGGVDDKVVEFDRSATGYAAARSFPLGHKSGEGLLVKPEAAGLAVSPDARRVLVANVQNDSVSLIDLATGLVSEFDLRPGKIDPAHRGEAGGTFPRAVAWTSPTRAWVASERDRELIGLDVRATGAMQVFARVAVGGQPVALLTGPRDRLYAALDNTDAVAAIEPVAGRLIETVSTVGPAAWKTGSLGGAGTNNLALMPDGHTLLTTNGGQNAVMVVRLSARAAGFDAAGPVGGRGGERTTPRDGDEVSEVVGAIPTGWYPTGVAVRPDGRHLFVVNGKSNAGPSPLGCRNALATTPGWDNGCKSANQYVWQLEKAGFLTLPTPSQRVLEGLTAQVARNNRVFASVSEPDRAKLDFLRAHIHHVVYIVKENRSYDQILGDLEVGDGDPRLAIFGRALTPNLHALASQFVDLDRFFDSGESSNTGWNWTAAARTNDWTEREAPVNYAERGLQYDQEGANRNLNVGLSSTEERLKYNPLGPKDADMLPGARDVAAPDGPGGAAGRGYLWDQALKAGLSVRNWGFYGDLTLYFPGAGPARTPLEREPWKTGLRVFAPSKASLMDLSDPYFRGFDQAFPDYWRVREWEREFDGFVEQGRAPNLMLLRLAHDHTGDFGKGLDRVDTVETEIADNDYAVGLVVQKISRSPFAADTLVFVIEDDAQDGPDHVDAHRSVAFIAGPFVRQGALISHRYTTVDLVRTIEVILGIEPMGLNDALADPMAEVFDPRQATWSFEAKIPAALRQTSLPLPPAEHADTAPCAGPTRSAAYWAAAMKGQDFTTEDHLDTASFNRALWRGFRGQSPYPEVRGGANLRDGRPALLARSRQCG